MKKNIVLMLSALALSLPLLAGLASVAFVAVSVFLVYTFAMHTFIDYVKCAVAVIVFSAAALVLEPVSAVCFAACVLPVSYFMGQGIRKKAGFEYVIVTPAILYLAVITAMILYLANRESTTAFNLLFGDTMSVLKQTLAQTRGMEEYADGIASQMELMFPSMLIVYAHFMIYIIFGISRTVLEKRGYMTENMPHFYQLHLSRTFTSIFLIILMFSLFGGMSAVSLNIITVVIVLFSVCGLSVCDFYLRRRKIHTVVRILIYAALFLGMSLTGVLGSLMMFALFGVGIYDSYKPLRPADI